MIEVIQYTTEVEKQAAIEARKNKYVIEERLHSDGMYLVFDDQPLEDDAAEYRKLFLANLIPKQVDSYIDNNVTNLADVKTILKLYGKALILLKIRR